MIESIMVVAVDAPQRYSHAGTAVSSYEPHALATTILPVGSVSL